MLTVTDPAGPITSTEVKVEFSKGHKKRLNSARAKKHQDAQLELEKLGEEKTSRLYALRTSMHCVHCDRALIREFFKDAHENSCEDNQRTNASQKKMAAAKGF